MKRQSHSGLADRLNSTPLPGSVDTVISANQDKYLAGSADVPSALANNPADEDVGAPITLFFAGWF
jgi:hypothetical protein